MRWEGIKSFIPALLLVPIHLLVVPLPHGLIAVLLAACAARGIFVFVNAGIVALRLNDRRAAFLKAAGHDLSLSSLLADGEAWKVSLSGGTMRDFLTTKEARAPKVR